MWPFLLSACLEARPPAAQSCTDCHGSETSSAPPTALGGATEISARGVGAHQAHLQASAGLSAPVACEECHLVPAENEAEGHVDTPWPAEVTWANGTLAKVGAAPFDAAAQTCVVYCHGSTLDGGPAASPPWTDPQGLRCDSCHGFPPAAPHPQDSSCGGCHPGVGAAGIEDPTTHLDGEVQLGGGTTPTTSATGDTGGGTAPASCAGCHGEGDDPAPPPDTSGSSDPSRVSVGAHQTHLRGTGGAAPVACEECHVVYPEVSAPGHLRNDPGDVSFGALSSRRGHAPSWNGTTCADSYCHDFGGGTIPAPEWTRVDGSQVPCGSCHSLPPPGHFPANDGCGNSGCHDSTFAPGLPHTVRDASLHANGRVDF